jgi:anthranilate synthase component 1
MKQKRTFEIKIHDRVMLSDTLTPVALYLKLRDLYPLSILLEGSDYHGGRDNYSFICLEPLAGVVVQNNTIESHFPDGQRASEPVSSLAMQLDAFIDSFQTEAKKPASLLNGFFGYMSYDAASWFESVPAPGHRGKSPEIPDIQYHLYHYIIAINHFRNTITLIENRFDQEPDTLHLLENVLTNRNFSTFPFQVAGEIESNLSDDEYKRLVSAGKRHCHLGDVYQIVLSRRFEQAYKGDEFNVYRHLRSINPSPYLFYFDYGRFRLFGSSPEAHLVVKNGKATIAPIAGTFRRTGDDERDLELADQLSKDPKENAEHVMLVDLARNDLSRHARSVKVEKFREIQYFSHVLHMVSSVSGTLPEEFSLFGLLGETFPAGTLSGAPKIRAMELIHELETSDRGFYGGCIGQIGFNRSLNQAIMIRSFLAIDQRLYFQAGAGIVSGSNEDSELNEVNNKLAALRQAIVQAART